MTVAMIPRNEFLPESSRIVIMSYRTGVGFNAKFRALRLTFLSPLCPAADVRLGLMPPIPPLAPRPSWRPDHETKVN